MCDGATIEVWRKTVKLDNVYSRSSATATEHSEGRNYSILSNYNRWSLYDKSTRNEETWNHNFTKYASSVTSRRGGYEPSEE